MKVRALQKLITWNCSEGSEVLRDKCFSPKDDDQDNKADQLAKKKDEEKKKEIVNEDASVGNDEKKSK